MGSGDMYSVYCFLKRWGTYEMCIDALFSSLVLGSLDMFTQQSTIEQGKEIGVV